MDPRISFSNDFVDAQYSTKYESNYREAPVSADFEFSIKNYTMIPADEIFFQGMLLPLKANCAAAQMRKITLRDELLAGVDEFDHDVLPRESAKGSGWWKERLGLKKSDNTPGKIDINDHGALERVGQEKVPVFVHEEGLTPCKRIREVLNGD